MMEPAQVASRRCDGLSRRTFLKAGALSAAGLTLPDVLRARAEGATAGKLVRDTAVILLWLDGGPTHMDTYDMKPDQPAEYRGMFQAIHTNVPGIQISEMLPRQARLMDRLAIIRSMHHQAGDHINGPHQMLTGYYGSTVNMTAPMYPAGGSITAKLRGPNRPGMPPYVSIPQATGFGGFRPGYHGAAYLGVAYNPFDAGGDPNNANFQVPNLNLAPGLSAAALEDRRSLLKFFSTERRKFDADGQLRNMDRFDEQAFELITGKAAREAFDLSREDPRLRDRYGRHLMGQGCLLARRLVEAGVTFVTIQDNGWDHHGSVEPGMKNKLPMLDAAVSALVEDLYGRGLDQRVLLIVMGEFGRTPRVNGSAGRDHWPDSQFVLLSGGGFRMGQVIGATNSRGEFPKERPLTPKDLWATVYQFLGIPTETEFINPAGRPIPVLDSAQVISELV